MHTGWMRTGWMRNPGLLHADGLLIFTGNDFLEYTEGERERQDEMRHTR